MVHSNEPRDERHLWLAEIFPFTHIRLHWLAHAVLNLATLSGHTCLGIPIGTPSCTLGQFERPPSDLPTDV